MYRPLLTARQMQSCDQRTTDVGQLSGFELMARAGAAVARAATCYAPDSGRVVIIAGPGNNGGDGFAAARVLRQKNIPVTLIPLIPLSEYRGDAAKHAKLAEQEGVKIRQAVTSECLLELQRWLPRSVVVVDAIFGTGLARQVEGHMADAIACINGSGRTVLAVDIASGISADTGEMQGCAVRADFTLPIAAYKWGHWKQAGAKMSGTLLEPASIGITQQTMLHAMAESGDGDECAFVSHRDVVRQGFPPRSIDAHKNDFGHVWVFGGSVGFTGAPILTAHGALAAGAGLVSVVCPDDVWPVVASSSLEAMVHPVSQQIHRDTHWRADVLVAGPGWGKMRQSELVELIALPQPLVLDADALNMVAADMALQKAVLARRGITVLTPHPGEAARLLGVSAQEIQKDRKKAALKLSQLLHGWVVLKGHYSLIASPDGCVVLNPFGTARLATAGSGDVLVGVIAASLARCCRHADASEGVDSSTALDNAVVRDAVIAAVALHGQAGDTGDWYRAGQLVDQIAGIRLALASESLL
ncbi:MAG: bifunctional ADP-dependent NAD(P)H-hydrate dehydratase/NAD(P)H-hydrate epimerase [Zetaproteobacteria bacterium CG_4_9_14_3_um_filter_49_83]|nr:MAG: bifunctional ADP-dependent NAD(P)H-hydrate dehydratase/NAD(P)H-hydrate epimerase [Zetaproteobacteria bacterium CG17_big_fil_post_rev_8_21_14_2_50_50_13]PIV29307.1 MAG: bifunctional ADP-dependent NAD(P)H-hydrate dehydratase/NAD(P)H-hydrate epimerase [Zetaproteobacteria bacterium CG02_land_8_20_14_3_00_50_9]PIY56299.1 MAG: bifunctional ADP-dependent NAD(P)H-hydrate dehydratase/NAD(P)H-hydrate epimerase [Zetaproteobacteria bacterium CG_4_10_14_0_8_um_filter_49_80]PJA34829.1 MAG: bifunctiona